MDGKFRNMASLYLRQGDSPLLLYRVGSRVIPDSWIAAAGGHLDDALYVGAATESGVMFTEMREF